MNEVEIALERDGAVRIEHAVSVDLLDAYRKQRAALLERVEAKWCRGILSGNEAPNFIDVDIAWSPPIHNFVRQVDATLLGARYSRTHRLTEAKLRLVSPSPVGYLNWHIDHLDGPGLLLKALIYLEDVPLGGGDFGYIPGSHLHARPGREEEMARSFGYLRFPGRAGSAVLFDTAGAHAPSANKGCNVRQTLLLSFSRW